MPTCYKTWGRGEYFKKVKYTPGGCAGQCSHTTLKQAATEVHVSAFHQPILPLPLAIAHCVLQKLPNGEKPEEHFTKFQIKRGVSANPITTTTQNTTLGVYVDTSDGWKMKLTEKEEDWDKFSIAGHTLSSPEITATEEARSDS